MENLTREELKELIKESIREILIEEGLEIKGNNENPVLKYSVRSLKMKTLILNSLKVNEIHTIADLTNTSRYKLNTFSNIGKRGLEDIELKLKELNLELLD